MISVIVPVYNVEPYLRKCLDSILAQTYQDLEILIIDDGSTDGSGKICDEYKQDERVRVFHTENHGLSAARNLGLDNATGDWIGFVDSDDWIEPDMYEVLLRKAEETGADVVECGVYLESQNKVTIERHIQEVLVEDPLQGLIRGEILNRVWDKIWKRELFSSIKFPEGRINEDIATTYKVLENAYLVLVIDNTEYHYCQRCGSLSHMHDMKSLTDFWRANYERKQYLSEYKDERLILLRGCITAAARTWAYYCDCSDEEKENYHKYVREMNEFTCKHIPLFGYNGWSKDLRIGSFFPHFQNRLSFRVAWMINRLRRSDERRWHL